MLEYTWSTVPAWQCGRVHMIRMTGSCHEPCSHATRPSSKGQRPIEVANAGSWLAPERLLHQPLTGGTRQPHAQY